MKVDSGCEEHASALRARLVPDRLPEFFHERRVERGSECRATRDAQSRHLLTETGSEGSAGAGWSIGDRDTRDTESFDRTGRPHGGTARERRLFVDRHVADQCVDVTTPRHGAIMSVSDTELGGLETFDRFGRSVEFDPGRSAVEIENDFTHRAPDDDTRFGRAGDHVVTAGCP